MTAEHTDVLRARLAGFGALSEAELLELDGLQGRRRHVAAGTQLIHDGQVARCGYVLRSGWASLTKMRRDGGRQVVDIHVPGDFIGVSQLFLPAANLNHEAVTGIEIAEVSPEALLGVASRGSRITRALFWALAIDEARLAARLTDIGRCAPQVRTARCLLELSARAERLEGNTPLIFPCPLSQYIIADMLGLSAVHLNRVLRQLREMNLASFRNSVIRIHDLEALLDFAGMQK